MFLRRCEKQKKTPERLISLAFLNSVLGFCTYIIALSTNKELKIASPEVAEKTAQECANYPIDLAGKHLKEIRLILDKNEPDYKN